MEFILNIGKDTILYIFATLVHNLPALVLGVLIAAAIKVYLDPGKMKDWLTRRSSVSIPATVVFGAFTPFCACGTMAVVLSMMATALPWGPIMAFLTSSPLMSPEGFVLFSGIIGPSFAIALTVASVIIGVGSGYITHVIEKKTNFLQDQLRFLGNTAHATATCCSASQESASCCSAGPTSVSCCSVASTIEGCGCSEPSLISVASLSSTFGIFLKKYKIDEVLQTIYEVGIKKILPLFSLFAGIGYLINQFIPSEWITAAFGAQNVFAVPLAAVIGIPLYVNGDSSIPLIQSLMQSGVSTGAMLAFMITGPGTSAGVIAGISTIMKRKAVALYVTYLLLGGILLGYAYDLIFTL